MTMMTVAALQKAGEALLSSEKIEIPLLDQVFFTVRSVVYNLGFITSSPNLPLLTH